MGFNKKYRMGNNRISLLGCPAGILSEKGRTNQKKTSRSAKSNSPRLSVSYKKGVSTRMWVFKSSNHHPQVITINIINGWYTNYPQWGGKKSGLTPLVRMLPIIMYIMYYVYH